LEEGINNKKNAKLALKEKHTDDIRWQNQGTALHIFH
jgi:hypothetical protein